MITSKDIDELRKTIDDFKTEQRKVNNILAKSIEELEEKIDSLRDEAVVVEKVQNNYAEQQRRKNMEKYLNTITCGPSAFKVKEMTDYAEN